MLSLQQVAVCCPGSVTNPVAGRTCRMNRLLLFMHLAAPLQEATELSALFLRVETVFAGGDVPAIAETLATMRRSLLLVGDVPEFKGGMERLEVVPVCVPCLMA